MRFQRISQTEKSSFRSRGLLSGCILLCLVASASVLLASHAPEQVKAAEGAPSVPVLPGICSESDRFGLATTGGRILDYDVGQLHAGWYMNFSPLAGAPRPADMTFIQMIRLSEDEGDGERACAACPTWLELEQIVETSPRALWLIGNEPDSMAGGQDNITPGRYAELYKELHSWLKEHDPGCLVAIGGVVQPTPIRLEYLQMIINSYAAQNPNEPFMPIDVWNTHNYVLRERRYGLPDSWGAGVPPGIIEDEGILYDLDEHTMLDPCDPQQNPDDPNCAEKIGWKQQLVNLRTFMKDHGYQDRPLIISEYGMLMPAEYGYDWATVKTFMTGTFDWLVATHDCDIGYPADGCRLVQAWAWWPFDFTMFGGMPGEAHLFNPSSGSLTTLGFDYKAYTAPLTAPHAGSVDLRLLSVQHGVPVQEPGGLVATISADVTNGGAQSTGSFEVQFQIDDEFEYRLVDALAPGETTSVKLPWSVQLGQTLSVHVSVDPDELILDCDPYNNKMSAELWIGDHMVLLPIAGSAPDQ